MLQFWYGDIGLQRLADSARLGDIWAPFGMVSNRAGQETGGKREHKNERDTARGRLLMTTKPY